MKVGRWSTIAGNNNATPPDGFPEGQAPSTLNDGIREAMAAIRTVFNDPQFFDQDFTPTYVNATTFSVPGNQTSAIHAGRRLKLNDANVVYGTVATASFTTVTTINVEVDGSVTLTSSLTSFGISVISNESNGLPRKSVMTLSSVTVLAGLTVSGRAVVNGGLYTNGLSVDNTAVAANFAKAWVKFVWVNPTLTLQSNFNIASVSRSASGVFRVNFSNAFSDNLYTFQVNAYPSSSVNPPLGVNYDTVTAGSFKFRILSTTTGVASDPAIVVGTFYR